MAAKSNKFTKYKRRRIREEYQRSQSLERCMRMYPELDREVVHQFLNFKPNPPTSEPSEEEVAEKAREIRSRWSPEEAASRWAGRLVRRETQDLVSVSDILR